MVAEKHKEVTPMKICHCCTAQLEDDAQFCRNCGAPQGEEHKRPLQPAPVYQAPVQPEKDPFDHTEEFDSADIAAGKLWAMCVYLLDIVGIFLVLLGARENPYAMFHLRQGLKITVVEMLLAIAAGLLAWTFLVPIAAGIALVVLMVIKVVCFVHVCRGKAKEPAIIRKLGFLN